MAENEYLDLVSEPKSGANDYLDTMESDNEVQAEKLRGSMFAAVNKSSPDEHARIVSLANKMNVKPALIEGNVDEIAKTVELRDNDYFAMMENNPKTSIWLQDPDNATLAKDDIPNLKKIEDIAHDTSFAKDVFGAVMSGLNTYVSGIVKSHAIQYSQGNVEALPPGFESPDAQPVGLANLTTKEVPRELYDNAVTKYLDEKAKSYAPQEMSSSVISEVAEGNYARAARALTLQIASNIPQLGITAVTRGAGLPLMFASGAGNKLAENLDKGIDPTMARTNALSSAAIETGIETLGGIGGDPLKSSLKEIIRRAGPRSALEVTKLALKNIIKTSAEEGAEEAVTSVAQDLLDYATDVNPKALEGMGLRAADSFLVGFGSGGFIQGTSQSPVTIMETFRQSEAAQSAVKTYTDLGKAVLESKLSKRMPEKMQEVVAKQTQGTTVENTFIDVEGFETYYQSKNIPPAQAAAELGILEKYNIAKESGADIEINTAEWTAKTINTEHFEGLKNDIKFDAEALTVNQSKLATESIRAEVEAVNAEATEKLTPVSKIDISQLTTDEQLAKEIVTRQRANSFIEFTEKRVAEGKVGPEEGSYLTAQVERVKKAMDLFEDRPSKLEKKQRREDQVKQISLEIKDQLVEAGFNNKDAESQAALFAERYITRAERRGLGESPADLFRSSLNRIVQGESLNLETGEYAFNQKSKGDWESEGYNISESDADFEGADDGEMEAFLSENPEYRPMDFYISAPDGDGVGQARIGLTKDRKNIYVWDINIDEDHQRKGLATEIYQRAEKYFGKTLVPINQSEDAKALWSQPNRPFGNSEEFNQTKSGSIDEIRGRIRFGQSRMATIELFQHADLSTVLHESGHLWLDELITDATTEGVSQGVKDDMDRVLEWMGSEVRVKDGAEAVRAAIQTDQHEQWARGFEAYLMEGKAPNASLRKVFAKFKVWLTSIYKSISNLNVVLDDAVRGVMDRLISAETEVQKAEREVHFEPLFLDPKAVGMNETQAARYTEAMAEARAASEEYVRLKLMEDITKQQKAWYKEESASVRKTIEAEVNELPLYRTHAIITKGTLADGSPLPEGLGRFEISRQSVIDKYGEETAKAFPRGTLSNDGVLVDLVADMYGWNSTYEMVEALTRFIPKEQAIDEAVKAEMLERYPEMFNTPEISQAAIEAVHNNSREKLYQIEMDHLAKNNKGVFKDAIRRLTKKVPSSEAIREQAREVIGGMLIKDVRPSLYKAAEAKQNKLAGELFAKGDVDGALNAKRKAALNHELFRASTEARERIAKDTKNFKKIFRKDSDIAKTRDVDMVNAARSIVSQFGILKDDNPPEYYLKQMKEIDPDAYASVTTLIEAATDGVNFDNPTYNDFVAMSDGVNALWSYAKTSREILVDGQRMDRAEVLADLNKRMDEVAGSATIPGYKQAITEKQENKSSLLGIKARIRRIEHWAYAMDKGDINGAFTKYIFRPVRDAETRYNLAKNAAYAKINELKQYLDPEDRVEIHSTDLDYTFRNKQEILAALLHTGNGSNLWKLLVGRQWGKDLGDGQVDRSRWDAFINSKIADGTLTKKDFDFVQAVWDLNETFKPDAWKAHKQMYGYYPNEVTANEFTNQFGTYKGGYVPAIADPRMTIKGSAQLDKELTGNLNMTYALPTTGRGFTKARAERYSAPLLLDLNRIPSHIDKVLKFTHLEPAIKEVTKVISDEGLRGNIARVDPAVVDELIIPALQRSATQSVSKPSQGRGGRAFDKIASTVRSRASLQMMAMNVTNWMQNLTSVFPAMVRVGPKYMLGGLKEYQQGPSALADQIMEKSDYMKVRMGESAREISKEFDNLVMQPSKIDTAIEEAKRISYFGDRATNGLMERITWVAAYRQAVDQGLSEKDAINQADGTVRQTQTDASPLGVSSVESGTAFVRLFNMFSTYFNTMGNVLGSELAIANELGFKTKEGSVRAAKAYSLIVIAPAVASALIARAMAGKGIDEDDDGEYLDDIMDLFFGSQFRMLTAMVPGGTLINSALSYYNDKPYDDRINVSPVVSAGEQTFRAAATIAGAIENDKRYSNALRDGLVAIGMTTGIPTGIVSRPSAYLLDVKEGRANPENTLDFARGLLSGQPGQ